MATATIENGALDELPPLKKTGNAMLIAGAVNDDDIGPIEEYDRRVAQGRLKNDEHQRGKQRKRPGPRGCNF